ncbi:hypothetical protein BC829DRAFT_19524 [Chytridium lagenaria]|nr:hypothetical protein BC829DRAFT_19524 [Chytridium lagenaria]
MADPSTTNVNIPPQEGSSQNQRTRRHRRPRQKQANISSTEGLPQTASTSSTMNANVPMQTSGEPSGGGDRNGRGSLNPNASSFTPGGPRRNPPSADAPQEPPRSRNRRSRGRGTGPSTPQQAGQNLPPSPATIPMGPSSNNSESNRRRQGPRPQNGQGPAPRPQNSQGSWRPQNTPGPPQRQHRPTEPIQNLKVAEPNTGGRRLPNINTPRRPQKPQIDPTDLVESLTASLSDGSYECMVLF